MASKQKALRDDRHDFRAGDLVSVPRADGMTFWQGQVQEARVNRLKVWHRATATYTWVKPEGCQHREFNSETDIGSY